MVLQHVMVPLNKQIRNNWPYFILVFLMMDALGIYLILHAKADSFRTATAYFNGGLDLFFKYLTHLGDGLMAVFCVVLLFAIGKRFWALYFLAGYAFSGLIAQLIKNLLPMPRPKVFFESMGQTVREIEGITVHTQNSFPSGHTTTAFLLATMLVLMAGKRWWFPALLLAVLVGYSRVYLSQHFPVDVLAGAFLGTLSALLVYGVFYKIGAVKRES